MIEDLKREARYIVQDIQRRRGLAEANRKLNPRHPTYIKQLRNDIVRWSTALGIAFGGLVGDGLYISDLEPRSNERVMRKCEIIFCREDIYRVAPTLHFDPDEYIQKFPDHPPFLEVKRRLDDYYRFADLAPAVGIGAASLTLAFISGKSLRRRITKDRTWRKKFTQQGT